jgi:hypothetical protein
MSIPTDAYTIASRFRTGYFLGAFLSPVRGGAVLLEDTVLSAFSDLVALTLPDTKYHCNIPASKPCTDTEQTLR